MSISIYYLKAWVNAGKRKGKELKEDWAYSNVNLWS